MVARAPFSYLFLQTGVGAQEDQLLCKRKEPVATKEVRGKAATLATDGGKVDAGESSPLQNIRKSSSLWPPSFAQSGMAWRLTSLPKSLSVETTSSSFHLYKTAIRHHSPPATIRMRIDGFAGRLIVRTTVRQLSIIFNHGGGRNA